MKATINGKPVRNVFLAIVVAMIAVLGGVLVVPLHPLFWLFGRKGIIRPEAGSFTVIFDATSFEPAE